MPTSYGAVHQPGLGPHAIRVVDASDPRLADYRRLKERDLAAETGRFVAESERVVRRLIESPLSVASLLATPVRFAALADLLAAPEFPVYVAEQSVLDAIAGFHVHRGCLAIGQRPTDARVPKQARTVVVLEDLVDVDNVGAIARNAAAFGADAIVMSPRCADPFYRKAIRVALGAVFFLPIVRLVSWPQDLHSLKQAHDLTVVGAVVDGTAMPLPQAARPARLAIVFGSEGPGLSVAARAACDALVTIPMAPAADSLNVATAAAVALYHFQRAAPTGG